MNERIRSLALQAKQSALTEMIKIHDKEQALTIYSDTYDTKFAQLIVRECIRLNGKELAMSGHYKMLCVYHDHFGIEECDDEDHSCPACGVDGGTGCGSENCKY